MRDNELASIRSGMVGMSFRDNRGDSVTVINVTRASNGFSVIFNYGAEHNVFVALVISKSDILTRCNQQNDIML